MALLAERPSSADTQLLDKKEVWFTPRFLDAFTVEAAERTAGIPFHVSAWLGDPHVATQPFVSGLHTWGGVVSVGEHEANVMFLRRIDFTELASPEENDFTYSLYAPMFEAPLGTGELFSEIRDSVHDVWRGYVRPARLELVSPGGPLLLDIPNALQEARSRAGLPVQDLAAMFGIKRRQFYNLMSGESAPEQERQERIARVTTAIAQISDWVGGNSRRVRAALLARLDGDSIYQAAIADDESRLNEALGRIYALTSEGTIRERRLAPSHRATSAEAAAVREFLRATRDNTDAASD